ncbi:MAG: hypothetical protein KJ571_18040 [Bacteroidetes bacterium]|nr:hypothetical protein [Bacteroidota bacterium]
MKIFLPYLLFLGVLVLGITNCSSSEKSSDSMKIEEAPPPLSPGTAAVEAEVVSSSDSENGTVYKIKILKVLEYGSSTPSLAEDSEMETLLSKSLAENNNIENGKKFKFILRSGSPLGEESKNSNWIISKIYQ